MKVEEMKARVGTTVSESEMVEMMRSQPIGTSDSDVMVRAGTLSFSFGPGGVVLTGVEERKPCVAKGKT